MKVAAAQRAQRAPLPTFRLACWALAVCAFVEVVTAAVGLGVRFERSREVRVVSKDAPTIITLPAPESPARRAATPTPPVSNNPQPVTADPLPLPPATRLAAPPIADPEVERLVGEAREARVAEDLGKAIVKLEEAKNRAPRDPNVLYEFGLVYELMGVCDLATANYQQVFELGTSGAGALYELAAGKLRDGFEQPQNKQGRLSLGRVRVFKDPSYHDGERVILTIPLQAVPGENIQAADLAVEVRFFDDLGNGNIQPAAANAVTSYEWRTLPLDWQSGEELLQVSYIIPPQDNRETHLFGTRHYHGQVVELSYRGVLLDSQAWPRVLARKVNAPERDPLFLDPASLPPGYNPDSPLLPLPER